MYGNVVLAMHFTLRSFLPMIIRWSTFSCEASVVINSLRGGHTNRLTVRMYVAIRADELSTGIEYIFPPMHTYLST